MTGAIVTRAGEGASSMLGPDRATVVVSGAQTGGAFAVLHWRGVTRGGPPIHVHPDQDEIFVVQQGDYRFRCGEDDHHLGPGDTIFLPRDIPHTFAQLSETGELLFMFTPAGRMEAFFEAAAALPGVPSPDAAAALFADHEMRIVGPPLALD